MDGTCKVLDDPALVNLCHVTSFPSQEEFLQRQRERDSRRKRIQKRREAMSSLSHLMSLPAWSASASVQEEERKVNAEQWAQLRTG